VSRMTDYILEQEAKGALIYNTLTNCYESTKGIHKTTLLEELQSAHTGLLGDINNLGELLDNNKRLKRRI
jgi:hypothetical protein